MLHGLSQSLLILSLKNHKGLEIRVIPNEQRKSIVRRLTRSLTLGTVFDCIWIVDLRRMAHGLYLWRAPSLWWLLLEDTMPCFDSKGFDICPQGELYAAPQCLQWPLCLRAYVPYLRFCRAALPIAMLYQSKLSSSLPCVQY
eukprot:Gb_24926 [translate_table: standard]